MPEHSDGIAEELERQLQITLSTAAVIARRGLAQRQRTLEQAQRDSEQAASAAREQIKTERRLAAAQLQPVFDEAWWETATPTEIAGMWEQANRWREPNGRELPPSTFDNAADRIDRELAERAGLDATQLQSLAAVQELETEHRAAAEQPARAAGSHRGSTAPSAASSCRPGSPPPACPTARSTHAPSPTSRRPTTRAGPSLRPRNPLPGHGRSRPAPPGATVASSVWRARHGSRRRPRLRGPAAEASANAPGVTGTRDIGRTMALQGR